MGKEARLWLSIAGGQAWHAWHSELNGARAAADNRGEREIHH